LESFLQAPLPFLIIFCCREAYRHGSDLEGRDFSLKHLLFEHLDKKVESELIQEFSQNLFCMGKMYLIDLIYAY
jgi:hypothetical protein